MSTQQNRRFDALVFIGRFQPPHRGHLNVLKSALSRAERVCVLIGSTDKPRTIKDPFSFDERRQMLASLFDASERDRVTIAPLQDSTYNDGDWVRWVQDAVASALGDIAQRKVGLIGHEKDATSYYLRMFPQWEFRRRRCDRRHFRHRDPRPVFRRTHQQLRAVGRAGTRVRLARAFPHAAGIRAAEVGGRIHRRVSQGVGGGSVSRHVRDGRRGGRALGPYPARAPPQRAGPRPVGAAGRVREPRRAARRGLYPRAARGNRPEAAGPVLRGSIKDRQVFDHPTR